MLPLSPSSATFGWPIDNHQNWGAADGLEYSPMVGFASSEPYVAVEEDDQSPRGTRHAVEDATKVRKLNHNASERDRRKKINSLYSSLRALLPPSHQTKKLSTPETVLGVLKYIPELQKEVESLLLKKEKLLPAAAVATATECGNFSQKEKQGKIGVEGSSWVVSASRLGDREVAIHISTSELHKKTSLTVVLLLLEQNGLLILDVSSFQSFAGRTFYSIHLLVEGSSTTICESLSQKLLSLFEKWE